MRVQQLKTAKIIQKIAMLCPLVAGEAPMKARTLYKHFVNAVALPEAQCDNVPVNVPKVLLQTVFKAYPNPTIGVLSLAAETGNGVFDWELCTVTGVVLKTGSTQTYVETIDMSSLADGIYFIRVSEKGKKATTLKIVVVK